MVTLLNNWTASFNNVPTQTTLVLQGQNTIFGLERAMIAAGYTLQISANGRTSTLNTSGGDTWSTSADVVWGTNGSAAHSYFVAKSPSGMLPSSNQVYVMVSCGTGSTNNHLVNITFATAAFTSSGSVNSDPTAPANSVPFANKQYLHSTVVNSKYHYQYSTAGGLGAQTGNFAFQVSEDGTGRFHFFFAVLGSNGYETADGWPVAAFASFSEANQGGTTLSTLSGGSNSATFHFDGTMVSGTNLLNCEYNNSNDFMATVTSTGSGVSGNFLDYPFVIADQTSGKLTIKGYVVDFAWAPTGTGVSSGTVEPSSGSTTTTIVGTLWVPNQNQTPLL